MTAGAGRRDQAVKKLHEILRGFVAIGRNWLWVPTHFLVPEEVMQDSVSCSFRYAGDDCLAGRMIPPREQTNHSSVSSGRAFDFEGCQIRTTPGIVVVKYIVVVTLVEEPPVEDR